MNTIEIKTEYKIPSENYDGLVDAIAALNKRARRNKLEEITLTATGTEETTEEDGEVKLFFLVEVRGQSPRINGWQFVATIEHVTHEDGAWLNLVRAVPNTITEGELVAYRSAAPDCQHCDRERLRNNTYVLRSEASEYKQVGHSCLRDFLGYESPDSLALMAEIIAMADEACQSACDEDGEGGSGGKRYLSIQHFLSFVCATMNKYGWVSRSKSEEMGKPSTATETKTAIDDYEKCRGENRTWAAKVVPSDADREHTTKALEWIRGDAWSANNDWHYSIYVATKSNHMDVRHAGIVASLILAYDLTMQREYERKAAAASSSFQGEIGEKIVRELTCTKVTPVEGMYATVYLHAFVDTEGNHYKWFASANASSFIHGAGETYVIQGTVKDHTEYQGAKDTMITRCKQYVEKAKKPSTRKKKSA